eukprot:c32411_g1_i1 orf=3-188(-)
MVSTSLHVNSYKYSRFYMQKTIFFSSSHHNKLDFLSDVLKRARLHSLRLRKDKAYQYAPQHK